MSDVECCSRLALIRPKVGVLCRSGRRLSFVGLVFLAGCASEPERQSSEIGGKTETKKYLVNGKIVEPGSSQASEAEELFQELDRRKHCDAQALVDGALPALEAHTGFPLANNEPPAAKFVEGFIKLRALAQKMRNSPEEYPAIWMSLTGDGDKAFSQKERDDAVRLWKRARSSFDFTCPRPQE